MKPSLVLHRISQHECLLLCQQQGHESWLDKADDLSASSDKADQNPMTTTWPHACGAQSGATLRVCCSGLYGIVVTIWPRIERTRI